MFTIELLIMIIKQLSDNTTPITLESIVQYANYSWIQKESAYRSNLEIAGMIAGILIAVGFPTSYAIYHANVKAEYLASHPEYISYGKTIVESKSPEVQKKVEEIVSKAKNEPELDFDITPIDQPQESQEVKKNKPETKSGHQECEVTSKMIQSIISLEYDPRKEVSSKGATGRMQIMKPTWDEINRKSFGGKYPYVPFAKDPQINIKFGTKYLKDIKAYLDSHKKEWKTDQLPLIFACYFGGIGNVQRCKFDPKLIKSLPNTHDYMQRGSNLMGYSGNL